MARTKEKNQEVIDLKLILKTILRKKLIVISLTTFTTIIYFIKTINTKPTWQGNFNIVVKNQSSGDISSAGSISSSGLMNFVQGNANDENKTQELILSSPSVLMPVYKNVIENYKSKGKKIDNLSYSKWFEDELIVKFSRGTNVLKISHINKDKELILETLSLISNQYKEFSKKAQEKNIIKTIKYLENQIEELTPKSMASQKSLNLFSLKHGLGNTDGILEFNPYSSFNNIAIGNNVDSDKNGLANQLPNKINSLKSQRYLNQYKLLEEYEAEFTDLSGKLKPSSYYLNELKVKIDNLKSALKRPTQILIEYRTLVKKALRDETLLNALENNLDIMKLEKNKTTDPWELISIPTIEQDPIHPKLLQSTFIAFIFSFFASSALSVFIEKKSGFLYEFDDIVNYLNIHCLDKFNKLNASLNKKVLESYLKNNIIKINDKEIIGIISLNSLNDSKFDSKEFEIPNTEYTNLLSLDLLEKYAYVLFIINHYGVSKKDLDLIKKYKTINKNKIIGWIYREN